MDTVGFTNLPLDPVTVDSMMEALLRNTDEHLNRFCSYRAYLIYIYNPKGKGGR